MEPKIPRIVAIVYITLLTIFSFDVFAEYSGFEALIAFLMHNIPAFILICALVMAWKYPQIGGWMFIAAGIISVFFFKTYQDLIVFFLISLPIFAVGSLFLLIEQKDMKRKKK